MAAVPRVGLNFSPSLLLESRNTRNGTSGIGCPLSRWLSLLKAKGMESIIEHPSTTESLKIFFLTEKAGVFGKMSSIFVSFILHCLYEWLHLTLQTGSWKFRNSSTAAGAVCSARTETHLMGAVSRFNGEYVLKAETG